jgi:hypothetical protein
VCARFAERGIAVATVGQLDASRVARVRDASGEEAVVWDFAVGPLIGCGQDDKDAVR